MFLKCAWCGSAIKELKEYEHEDDSHGICDECFEVSYHKVIKEKFSALLDEELRRQKVLEKTPYHDLSVWMMILSEEVGELSKAILKYNGGQAAYKHVTEELIHSVATLYNIFKQGVLEELDKPTEFRSFNVIHNEVKEEDRVIKTGYNESGLPKSK